MSQDASPQFDYEIHITVKTSDVEKFKMICSNIGVKAIVVELSEDGQHSDVMTSSTIKDDEKMLNVHSEIERICNAFTDNSLSPIRSKVETVPWHPQAPSSTNKLLFKAGQHFECHFAFRVNSLRELEMLTVFAKRKGLHISRNIFKKNEDGSSTWMLTLRAYMSRYEIFKDNVDSIVNSAKMYKFVLDKEPRIEFAIFDSNINHDDGWLKNKGNAASFNVMKFLRVKKFTS